MTDNTDNKKTTDSPVFEVDNITVSFPSTVSIADAAALKLVLDRQITECAVILDMSGVDVIDAATLQTVLAFSIEAEKNGVFIDWESPSNTVLNALQLLGISGLYGLPEAA